MPGEEVAKLKEMKRMTAELGKPMTQCNEIRTATNIRLSNNKTWNRTQLLLSFPLLPLHMCHVTNRWTGATANSFGEESTCSWLSTLPYLATQQSLPLHDVFNSPSISCDTRSMDILVQDSSSFCPMSSSEICHLRDVKWQIS